MAVDETLAREAFRLAAAQAAACDDLRDASGGVIMKASELRAPRARQNLKKELLDLLKAQFSLRTWHRDSAARQSRPA